MTALRRCSSQVWILRHFYCSFSAVKRPIWHSFLESIIVFDKNVLHFLHVLNKYSHPSIRTLEWITFKALNSIMCAGNRSKTLYTISQVILTSTLIAPLVHMITCSTFIGPFYGTQSSLSLSLSLTHTHTHTHILTLCALASMGFSLFPKKKEWKKSHLLLAD